MAHILRVANFVSPTSGGIKTALRHWGEHYRRQGHRVSLIVPRVGPEPDGDRAAAQRAAQEREDGSVHRVPAVPIPGQGYSVIVRPRLITEIAAQLAPDLIEVSDRVSTRWLGQWARTRGIGSVMISHENLTGILHRRTPLPPAVANSLADRLNAASARGYDRIVCPSRFAAQEFTRLGVAASVVPLGVDLDTFSPHPADLPGGSRPRRLEILHCGRLAKEKNPALSIRTLEELVRRGVDARLTVLGHGPMHGQLRTRSAGLPVVFEPYLSDRSRIAELMRSADVAIAPGPVETFGLAALEAMACGTPVVCPDQGALQEVVGSAGVAAPSDPAAFADAVLQLTARSAGRVEARRQAERFTWENSARRMLEVHHEVLAAV